MFWENIKAKGKLRLGAILALCAVVLGCATFAFTGIFGGLPITKTETVAEAAAGNTYTLNGADCAAQAAIWTNAIKDSITNGTQVTVKMEKDWVAETNATYGTAFSTNITTNSNPADGSYYLGAVTVGGGANIILDLNGHTINRNMPSAKTGGVVIYCSGATLTINDSSGNNSGTITGGKTPNSGDFHYRGGGIHVENGSVFTFNAGTLCDNESGFGGGLFGMGSTYYIKGGLITRNKSTSGYGGGVYLTSGSIYGEMTGGTISYNTSTTFGGGFMLGGNYNDKTFEMKGGTIEYNTSGTHGGGVVVDGNALFKMSGGIIRYNTSGQYGGGIHHNNGAQLHISGGSIYGNHAYFMGGGVNTGTTTAANISGNPKIYGNYCSQEDEETSVNNIHVKGNQKIIITDKMTSGANVGATLTDSTESTSFGNRIEGAFTSGYTTAGNTALPKNYFFSDTITYVIVDDLADGEAQIGENDTPYDAEFCELWNNTIASSIASGTQRTFTLTRNWVGNNGVLGQGIGFYDSSESTQGGLYIPSNANILLKLNGKILNRACGAATSRGCVIYVNGGKLTIEDTASNSGTITGGWNNSSGGGILVNGGGEVTLNSGTISGNKAPSGGGVYGTGAGDFTLSGGVVSGNQATSSYGGGLYFTGKSKSIIITSGTITGNTAASYGGGILSGGNGCHIYMSGGSITNNTAGGCGGGIAVDMDADFVRTISLTGGSITDNKCASGYEGAGVCLRNTAANGDVYEVGGNMQITGNKAGTADANFYVNAVNLKVKNAFTGSIGVRKSGTVGVFCSNWGEFNSTKNPWDYFTSDNSSSIVGSSHAGTNTAKTALLAYSATKPTFASASTYSGSEKTLVTANYDSTKMTGAMTYSTNTSATSGSTATFSTKATNAGKYFYTFTPATNYVWGDSHVPAAYSGSATINYASITASPANVTKTYTGKEFVVAKTGTTVTSSQTLVGVSATTVGSQAYTYKFSTTITNGASGNWTNADTSYKITNVNANAVTVYYQITADNHNAKYGSFTVKVNNATIGVSVSGNSWTYDGTTHRAMVSTGTAPTGYGKISLTLTVAGSQTATLYLVKSATQPTSWGSASTLDFKNVPDGGKVYYKITAANHDDKIGSFDVTISKASLTDASSGYSEPYDGSSHSITVSASGFKTGDTWANAAGKAIKYGTTSNAVTATSNPTATDVSTTTVYYIVSFTNYNNVEGNKTLKITQKALGSFTIAQTGVVNNKTFDGTKTGTLTGNKIEFATLPDRVGTDEVYIASASSIEFADANQGTGKTVTVKGITLGGTKSGNYSIATTVSSTTTANIDKFDISSTTSAVGSGSAVTNPADVTYTGAAQAGKPVVKVKLTSTGDTTLAETSNYTLTYNNDVFGAGDVTGAGTVEVTITGAGNYTGTTTATYTIKKAVISAVEWDNSTSALSYDYDGAAHEPTITKVTTKNNSSLASGAVPADLGDMFTYSYTGASTDNIAAGDYKVTASLSGDYAKNFEFDSTLANGSETGQTEKAYVIALVAITAITVTAYVDYYDRKKHGAFTKTEATVVAGTEANNNNNLKWWYFYGTGYTDWKNIPDGEWTATMPEFDNAGSYTVFYKITADNHEASGGSRSVTINKKEIGYAYDAASGSLNGSILPTTLSSVPYTGNAVTTKSDLSVKVMLSASEEYTLSYTDALKEYTLSFSNNIKAGTATITITADDINYSGSRTINFTINKANITDPTLTPYTGTFDGAAHNVINDGYTATLVNGNDDDTNTATWYFRVDGTSSWSTTMPTLTNATEGTKVYYKITAPSHNDIEGESYAVTVVIDKKDISTDYRLNGDNDKALDNKMYTGEEIIYDDFDVEQELISGSWTKLNKGTDYEISYSDDHTNVGEVTVTVTGKGNYTNTNTIKFNIVAADGMTASAQAYGGTAGKTYDGLFHAAVHSQTVTAVGGNEDNNVQWWYSYDDLAADSEEWENEVPQIKNVTSGTTVYWMVTADNNAPVRGSVTAVIVPRKITAVDGIAADGKVYDGSTYYLTGDNGSVKTDGTAASVHLDNANKTNLTGYVASVEDYEGENKITREDDLKIVWATGVDYMSMGEFGGSNKGTYSVTIPYGSLALDGDDADNYELELTADIVITDVEIASRVVVLQWTGLEQNWNNNQTLRPSVSITNLVTGDNVTASFTITQNNVTINNPTAPGDYHVAITILNGDTNENYTLVGAEGLEQTFSITTTSTVVFYNVDGLVYDGSAKMPKIYYEVAGEGGTKTQVALTEEQLEAGTSFVIKDANKTVVSEAKNAGNYTVTLQLNVNHVWDGDLNGIEREKTIPFTIAKATVEGMKLEAKTDAIYSGSAYKLAVDWTDATLNGEAYGAQPDGVTVTVYYNGVASDGVINVGNHKVTARFTVNGNYNAIAPIEDVDLIIAKASITLSGVEFANKTENYTGEAFTVAVTGAEHEKISITYSYEKDGTNYGANGVSAVGEYTVTATFGFVNAADKDNYKIIINGEEKDTLTATLTIDKQTAVVSGVVFEDSLNEKYDGNIHRLLVSGSAVGVKSVSYEYATDSDFTNVISTDGVKDAGTYYVRATFTVDDNYAPVAPIEKMLVIAKADLTVKADDKTITFGDDPATAMAAHTATVTGLVGDDTVAKLGTLSFKINGYTRYGNVDIYEDAISVSGLNSGNYNISYDTGDLTVKPREVSVVWYNDENKTSQDLTYTYDGTEHVPYADVVNAISGYPVTVTVEGGKTAAGMNYEAKALSLSSSNYVLPESGLTTNFDILPQTPKKGVIIWDYTTLYYNGAEQKPKAYFFENENDNVPKELSVVVNKPSVNVGEYTATALLDSNYSLTGETQFKFNIEKRTVHVVIGDLTASYAGTIDLSGVTWSYADGSLEFVSSESYSIEFSCGTITGPDTYPIKAEFVCGNSANYDVIFSGGWSKAGDTDNNGKCGTLTVTSAKYDMSKVTFTGTEVTYDGKAHELTISGLPQGVEIASVSYLLDGWNLGANGVTAAGTYTVIYTFSGDEHFEPVADIEKQLVIKQAALTVKANDKTITYGDAAATNGAVCVINGVTYELNDEKLAGELSGTLTLALEESYNGNAGKYKIIPAGLTSENYVISFVPGTLTVNPREITVTWYSDPTTSSTNLTYDYDGNKHTPFPVASGMLGNDKVNFSVDGGTDKAGLNYTATITGIDNNNYTVSTANASVSFSIVQKGVIIWDNTPLVYEKGKEQVPEAWYYNEATDNLEKLTVEVAGDHENAAEYTATVTDAPDYLTGDRSITYSILPQEVTIEIGTAANLTYGAVEGAENLEKVLADLISGFGFEGDSTKITLSCNVNNSTPVGTYQITGVCTDGNYTVTFNNGTLTIVKASVTDNGTLAAFNGKTATVTYDGKTHTIEVEGELPAGVTGVTYKYYSDTLGKYVAESDVVNAGVYTIEAVFTVDGNHEEVTGTYEATLTIEQAELSVKFDKTAYEFNYDGKLHSAQVTGDLTGVKSVKYVYDGVELSGVKDAKTYSVTAVIEVEDTVNYKAVTLDPVTLTINKVTLTVTANDGSAVYGDDLTDFEGFGYSVTGLAASDYANLDEILGDIEYAYETVTGAGVYKITILNGNASSQNYSTITYEVGKLIVTPYKLTADNIKWLDKQDGSAATDGKFSYTYKAGAVQQPYAEAINLINGETVTLVVEGGQINVGYNYEAKIVGMTGEYANNYVLPAEGLKAIFDILPETKTGTIIWDNEPLYYNGQNRKPNAYYFLEEDGDRIPLTVTVVGDSKNVGKYTATVNLDGLGIELSGDKSKDFNVVARPVYVEIGNLEVQYGDTPNMSAVSWKYVYADDATKQFLSGEAFSITFSCGHVDGVGTYPISAQFISDNAANYEVVFTGNWASAGADHAKYGTLTVVKASYDMSKVSIVGTEATYDGKLHTVTVIGLPDGVTASVTYAKDGFGYDANGVKNAGKYNVTVKFSGSENYGDIDDKTATLTIKKAALTVKANDKTIIYGDAPSANGVSYSGFAYDESGYEINDLKGVLSYTYGYVTGGNVGKYDITPAGFTSENYEITYKVGTLTVTARTITITWYDDETLGSQDFVYAYDEQYHAPYAVAGNLVEGDSLTLTVSGTTDLPGFNFVASVTELTNANYKLPTDGTTLQTFSIMPAPARSIVWDNEPIYYNGENRKPKAYYVEDDGSWTEITTVRIYVGGVEQSSYKNVGLYTATVIYQGVTSSQAYNILPVAITVVVGDAEVEYGKTLTLDNTNWTYAEGSNKFMESDLVAGAPITLRCPTYNAEASVGYYEITGSCTNSNYSVTFENGTLSVTKASYDEAMKNVVYGNLTAEYDGTEHTITISNLPNGVTATVSYESVETGKTYGATGVKDAGEYTVHITFTISDIVNYKPIADDDSKTLTISAKAANVAGVIFHNTIKTVTYNGKVQTMLASGSAEGVTGITYTYYEADGTTEVVGGAVNAGTYRVKAEFTIGANYDGAGIGDMWATLKIEQAKLTVTANDGSVVYGETANANGYGYSVSGLVSGDKEAAILGTLSFGYGAYSDAAVYAGAIIISGNTTSQNYDIEYVNGNLTVTPRTITITWFDEENGTQGTVFEYEYEDGKEYIPYAKAGNLAGSDELTLDVQVKRSAAGDNYVATVQALTNGNYALPASGITVNFTIKYNEADLPDHINEIVWDNATLYYKGAALQPSARYYDGTEWIEITDLLIKDSAGNEVESAINVGDYSAEYVDETGSFKNLKFNFKIVPRNVYIVIGDLQVKFGETPDMSKVSWKYLYEDDETTQFVSGDAYTLSFSVQEITDAKKYPIEGSLTGNANYKAVFTGGSWATTGADNGAYGTLTVTKATYDMSRVTFSGTDVTYNGTAYEITVNGKPDGVSVTSVTYTRGGWTYTDGVTNAGTYTVTVSFAGDNNHEAIADMTTTVTVKKAALTVTAKDNTITYGDAPKSAGVTYAGLAESDIDENGEPKTNVFASALTYEYNYLRGGNAGEYNITPKGLNAENYTITYVSGTLTVNKRTVTVIWYNDERMNSQTLRYNVDGYSHLPHPEAGNLVAGDSVELTATGAQSAAGINYQAKIVSISNPNYALPENITVYFEIVPAAYVVVWESMPFVFNGNEQHPSAYYYTVNGERVPLNVTVQEGAAVEAGTYHASASLISGNVQLSGEITNHEFTIAKREITIIVNDATSQYGEEITLNGWKYADGSAHFANGEPLYIHMVDNTVGKTTGVGTYGITGECTDNANYDVTFINGTYTITKAMITAPELASKVYTGEVLQADVPVSNRYTVIFNHGETNVGVYTVILLLNDYNNCSWADTHSQQYYLEFVIEQATNEWTTEFEVRGSVVAGSGNIYITEPEAKFGNKQDIVIKYYTDESCDDRYEVSQEFIVTEAANGTYYAKVSLAGAANYTAIEGTVYSFSVTGSLSIKLNWSNTSLTYNGLAQAPEAYIWLGGEQVMLVVKGAKTTAGTYEATTDLTAVDGRDLSGYEFAASGASASVEFTINARNITVHIDDDASSIYGTAAIDLSRLNWTITQGSVMAGDELGITFTCAVHDVEFADAGSYPIIGNCANGNYNVSFRGSWTGDDEYNGAAATYTVHKATITVSKSESTWFDEDGLIDRYKNYFVYLDATNEEDGSYKYITTKGGQTATVYYSTNIDKYNASVHDSMSETEIAQIFENGGSKSAPEIKQAGNFVIYYCIEAENHEVKYGIWKVLIQPKDRYIMITFNKPYKVTYGDSVEQTDILDKLIEGNYISVDGAVIDLDELRMISYAYAYEDVSSENGFVNGSTGASKYSIRFVFTDAAKNSEMYGNLDFRYSTTNEPNSDTNYDKYEITQRPITFGWTECTFTYDGELHLPAAKLTGLVGGEEYELTGLQLGENTITLANGDIINITVALVGNGDLASVGNYSLRVTIDNANYAIAANSDLVTIHIAQREVKVSWNETSFDYDGNKHIPEATVTIGTEVFTLKDFTLGVPTAITLANGDVINVTVTLVGNSDLTTGDYDLSVSIDNANYKVNSESESVKVAIKGYKAPFKLTLPTWAIYAIAGGAAALLTLIVILCFVLSKRKAKVVTVAGGDDDGFGEDYTG